jgi:hypothetical protein
VLSVTIAAGRLAWKRARAVALMPDTAEYQEPQFERTAQGSPRLVGWNVIDTYPIRIIPRRAQKTTEGEEPVSRLLFDALMPHDASVQAKGRLIVGGRTYEITGVDSGLSERVNLRVTLERRDD